VIVAIDGPSGVGKSTVARRVAKRLALPYLDTGAMYRAVGLAARRAGLTLPVSDPAGVVDLAERADIRVTAAPAGMRTFLNGEDVSKEIRTPEISRYASAVSAIPGVRRRLAALQRRLALSQGGVLEGRDIGTKIVPETPHKFFLTARLEVRARRRFQELQAKNMPQSFEQVLGEMEERDRADSTRADSPLTCDTSYTVIDTSDVDAEAVAGRVLAAVDAREKARG
jgi:cytidylate kinase